MEGGGAAGFAGWWIVEGFGLICWMRGWPAWWRLLGR